MADRTDLLTDALFAKGASHKLREEVNKMGLNMKRGAIDQADENFKRALDYRGSC